MEKHATSIAEAEELAQFELCINPDSLAHIIWECIEGEMQEIRALTTATLNRYVDNLPKGSIEHRFADAIRTLAQSHLELHSIWVGHWTRNLRNCLQQMCPFLEDGNCNDELARKLRKIAVTIGKLLATGVRSLWAYRSSQGRVENTFMRSLRRRQRVRSQGKSVVSQLAKSLKNNALWPNNLN